MSEWSWIKKIQKGDVLRSRSGMFRIVRRVSHCGASIPKTWVHMSIQRCSWTGRPYTIYNGNDLRQMGFAPVKANPFALRTEFDRELERNFDKDYARDCTLDCCDVRGIA